MFKELQKYKKLVLGFSGGADSTALALYLIERKIPFTALHFHHHLRTVSADNDASFCKAFCEKYELEFKQVDIPVYKLKKKSESIESAARRLRMEYWEGNYKQNETAVLLAHHKDDVVENLFIRTLRGSSASGLSGLREKKEINGVTYLRPLLELTKKEILSFLEDKKVQWCEDESNNENIYTRNIIRNTVIPEMEKAGSIEGIYRTADNLKCDALFIEEQALHWLSLNKLTSENFLKLHPALKPRIIRLFIQQFTALDFIPGHDAIQRISDEAGKDHLENARVPLGEGLEIVIAADGEFYIEEKDFSLIWNWQKENSICTPGGKLFISLERTGCCEEFKKSDLSERLTVRNWRHGDRMLPFSRSSETKVKDLFADRKTPHPLRKQLPLLISGQSIIWIPQVKRAEFGRCTSADETLIIAYERF